VLVRKVNFSGVIGYLIGMLVMWMISWLWFSCCSVGVRVVDFFSV